MAQALVATDFDLSLDVLRDVAAKVTLNREVRINELADLQDLGVREIAHLGVVVDVDGFEGFECPRAADPIDIGQTDFDPLVPREVNSGDSCHSFVTPDAACGEDCCKSPRRGHAAG